MRYFLIAGFLILVSNLFSVENDYHVVMTITNFQKVIVVTDGDELLYVATWNDPLLERDNLFEKGDIHNVFILFQSVNGTIGTYVRKATVGSGLVMMRDEEVVGDMADVKIGYAVGDDNSLFLHGKIEALTILPQSSEELGKMTIDDVESLIADKHIISSKKGVDTIEDIQTAD